jgi:hypothetical protein
MRQSLTDELLRIRSVQRSVPGAVDNTVDCEQCRETATGASATMRTARKATISTKMLAVDNSAVAANVQVK